MPNDAAWRAEARTFAAYLGSPSIPAEIAERYCLAVADWRVEQGVFDRWIRSFAAVHPSLTALADAYARIVRPYGDLRRRLTLILALLESHGTTHAVYDGARPAGAVMTWMALASSAALWALRTVIAFIVLAPMHAVASVAAPRSS
jgi:hypothetical protein